MKKIGIITVQKALNYGAVLQCYALEYYLNKLGYDCEVIDLCRPQHKEFKKDKEYKPYPIVFSSLKERIWYKLRHIRFFIKTIIIPQAFKSYIFSIKNRKYKKSKFIKFENFNKRIKFSQKYTSIKALYKNPPTYDIYMTGSDQLWNPTQDYCLEPYFLTFVNNGGKKVSYATSIGVSQLPSNVLNDFKKWLSSYDLISVREKTACNLLASVINQPIYQTVDPTFLLTKEEWKEIAQENSHKKYVFYFTLGYRANLFKLAQKIAKENNLEFIYYAHNYYDRPHNQIKDGYFDLSPEEWLGLIKNADLIITDSFHGSVFSIIFENNFISYVPPKSKRGSRISDLLSKLELSEHLITSTDIKHYNISKPINYVKVKGLLSKEIIESCKFLSNL